jgi:hypothetical protein
MDQASARQALGVDAEAAASDILAAYARRSRRLKRRFMEAVTVEARDRARRALRNLGILRDLALGARDARELRVRRAAERPVLVDDWWRPEDGVPMAVPDRPAALRWLGIGAGAAPGTIRRILDARARQVKLRIASATTEYDLHLWQQTLMDLRRVAALALAPRPGEPLLPHDADDTMTETPPTR